MKGTLSIANDNHEFRDLYQDAAHLLKHIPVAQYLIKKHAPVYWKNHPNDIEFVYFEQCLCGLLDMDKLGDGPRSLKVKWLAGRLGISPLEIYNDQSLKL